MWPFRASISNRELLERLESLERRFKTLLADVDEYFQLIRRAENRIKTKSAKMEEQEAGAPEAVAQDLTSSTHPGSILSPRQKEVQQQILRRRAGIQ